MKSISIEYVYETNDVKLTTMQTVAVEWSSSFLVGDGVDYFHTQEKMKIFFK
jgi:hypothetical protein